MNDQVQTFDLEILGAALYAVIEEKDNYPDKRPLLAHYTSMTVLEAIATKGEIWMSHPLMMNDTQELIAGLAIGRSAFLDSEELAGALGEKHLDFVQAYQDAESRFATSHAFDTYIFCLAEHDNEDWDGALSMWRGYGGNASGAAIVFDTSKLIVAEDTPFVLSKVAYRTSSDRRAALDRLAKITAQAVANAHIDEVDPASLAGLLFEYALQYSLYTKHAGFREEREWRLVYFAGRDSAPQDRHYHYHLGARGPEPRLRVVIGDNPSLSGGPISLVSLTDRILLGPTASTALAQFAVKRMLALCEKGRGLEDRVHASSTPFR